MPTSQETSLAGECGEKRGCSEGTTVRCRNKEVGYLVSKCERDGGVRPLARQRVSAKAENHFTVGLERLLTLKDTEAKN